MPFDVVKGENCSISGRQLRDGFIQGDAIYNGHRIRIFRAFNYLNWRFTVFSRRLHPHSAFTEVHQDLIDRKSMKPSSKGGFASKTADFSKELDENLLREVFSFRHTSRHPQAQGVDATIVTLEEVLESSHIALGCFLCQLKICRLRCLGIGCRHVVRPLGQAGRNFTTSVRLFGTLSRFRNFKGAHCQS